MERQISGPTNAVYASAWVPTLTSIKQINRFRSGDRRLHVCESAPASSMRRRIAVNFAKLPEVQDRIPTGSTCRYFGEGSLGSSASSLP